MRREETLLNVMRSVTKNGRSIFLTAVLAIILVYLFSIVGFLFFKDDFLMEVDRHPALSTFEVYLVILVICSRMCSFGLTGHYHVPARSWTHPKDNLCKSFQICVSGRACFYVWTFYRCNRRVQYLCPCACVCKHTWPCGCVEMAEDLLAHGTCCITQRWPHSLM